MRGKSFIVVLFGVLFLAGCTNKNLLTNPTVSNQTIQNSNNKSAQETVAVMFNNSVSKKTVEKIFSGMNIKPDVLYGFNGTSENIAVVNIPINDANYCLKSIQSLPEVQSAQKMLQITIND